MTVIDDRGDSFAAQTVGDGTYRIGRDLLATRRFTYDGPSGG